MKQALGPRYPAALTDVQRTLAGQGLAIVERMVRMLRHRWPSILQADDLASAGQMALVEAARDFNPSQGASFSTFASYRVQGAMINVIKAEVSHSQALVYGAYQAGWKYLSGYADPADLEHDTDEDDRRHIESLTDGLLVSLFADLVGEVLRGPGEEGIAQRELYRSAIQMLREENAKLDADDQELLYLHYGEGIGLKEIAERKHRGYATIRRHHASALSRLAAKFRERGIHSVADAGLEL